MIIKPFELTNLILDKKAVSKISDDYSSAYLTLVEEAPTFFVDYSDKLLVDKYCEPFSIAHPVFEKYTFKLFGHQHTKQRTSLFDFLHRN